MSLPFGDVILFKSQYRLAQQYAVEALWLEAFTLALQTEYEFRDAVKKASEECNLE